MLHAFGPALHAWELGKLGADFLDYTKRNRCGGVEYIVAECVEDLEVGTSWTVSSCHKNFAVLTHSLLDKGADGTNEIVYKIVASLFSNGLALKYRPKVLLLLGYHVLVVVHE